jgi:hypothetical protein
MCAEEMIDRIITRDLFFGDLFGWLRGRDGGEKGERRDGNCVGMIASVKKRYRRGGGRMRMYR